MPESINELDCQMMRRAIRLAMNGRGRVEPNPMVGCVIVNNGQIIGEGFHAQYGGPHAEPAALASCTESPAGATAYVTLEPCCHTNKKTPPCVPALIEAHIARVVVGSVDPNLDVNGQGIEMLQSAGIHVDVNVLEDQTKQLLAPFIARVVYGRPYVTLKWAQTADAMVAGAVGKRMQISNPSATQLIRQIRGRSDAIVVGINTVMNDDPMLTTRDVPDARTLRRVVLDSQLRIGLDSRLVQTARQHPVIVCFGPAAAENRAKLTALEEHGVGLLPIRDNELGLSLEDVLTSLAELDVTHALMEPGPRLAASFFERGLADRVWRISSPKRSEEPDGMTALPVPGDFVETGELDLSGDLLKEYLNPTSSVFFSAEPSADLVLAREGL